MTKKKAGILIALAAAVVILAGLWFFLGRGGGGGNGVSMTASEFQTYFTSGQLPAGRGSPTLELQRADYDPDTRAVLVDGQPVDETQFGLENGITDLPYSSFEVLEFPQTVPEGCVFVLGDNRNNSTDSRHVQVGTIDERYVLGKAVLVLFPLDRIGPI